MNVKALSFIKNLSYTISSNLISLIVSTLVVLVVPKLIGVPEYGYWQLYLFYTSYVGFLHFGWNDGIYLRYGGEDYENLDKRLFYSQYISLFFFQLLMGSILFLIAYIFVQDTNRIFIFKMISLSLIIINIRTFFLYILQATNRIKEYAKITIIDRVIYIVLMLVIISLNIRDFKVMILADVLSRFVSLIFAFHTCKEIVYNRITIYKISLKEIAININVGIKLMFANIAGNLIIGAVRFGIERTWDVSTFGKVSLTLSISNMMMIFINAIGIIMFPIIHRTDKEKIGSIYSTLRDSLMILLLGILVLYYPLKTIMTMLLPQYTESLLYMALVFPILIYEGKMALLISTYLKALRLEKVLLQINIISLVMSLIMTYTITQIFENLNLAILSIVILLAMRSALAETYLSKEINIKFKKDILLEIILIIIFILSGWFINSWITILIYGVVYSVYLLIKRKDIARTIYNVKGLGGLEK